MSAPPRGPQSGGTTNDRSTPPSGTRGRGTGRGSASNQLRGRGGRGRDAQSITNLKAEGLLQGLQTGSLNKKGASGITQPSRGEKTPSVSRKRTETCLMTNLGAPSPPAQRRHFQSSACLPEKGHSFTSRGSSRSTRGRGAMASRPDTSISQSSSTTARANPSHKDFMADMTKKFQDLKQRREAERAKAIRDGFLADPDKKTSLDKAITPVGTCIDMCPEFERVERIVQNMVEKPEKIPNEATGRDMPAEERMVKRFRRSAAGYDEQLPSDIRTPAALQATLNYLLNNVIDGEQLAAVHKFVWDRTRGIRNDFSIQQVSKNEEVRLAVDCFERIARFHILSLHQLSNPDNLTGEGFDAHQEREQLNNTLLSLMYYYDDNRDKQQFPNEAEFRAYCIIFELQSSHPDLEDRMQSWPPQVLNDKRVQTAFRLYSAATNTLFEQGPLKPTTPFSIAQANTGAFWRLLKSKAVSYMMSCVAEIYFNQIRYMALQNLWESHKGPSGQQIRNQEWTLDELTDALAFDDGEETLEFCQGYGLEFKRGATGVHHLDFTSQASPLDQSSTPIKQIFSHTIVEAKRYRRSLVAVINGIGVGRAIREGLIESESQQDDEQSNAMEEDASEGLFFPENRRPLLSSSESKPTSIFNADSSGFRHGTVAQPNWPSSATSFGKPSAFTSFTSSNSMSNASTSIAPSWPSLPSLSPNNSTTSLPASESGLPPPMNPFVLKRQQSSTSPSASTAVATTFALPKFQFGKPTDTTSTLTGTSSSLSLGKNKAAPSTFVQPSALQQDVGKDHSTNLEKAGDAPFFAPTVSSTPRPVKSPQEPVNEQSEIFPPLQLDSQPMKVTPSLNPHHAGQNERELADGQSPTFPEALSPFSAPHWGQENATDEPTSLKPPPSPRPARLELPEDFTKPLPSFLPPSTGAGFRFENPLTTSNAGRVSPPQITGANTTQAPTTAVFAPRQLPSFDSTPSTPSAVTNKPQPSFSWTAPPPAENPSIHPPRTRTESTSLSPSQYPTPTVPPKIKKPVQPKPKELKAVSPHDPTPRASSPLRERPVIFGDDANSFRQSAALASKPPPPRTPISIQDRDAAAETVAQLAMLQPAGLMQEYLQFTLPGLLKPVMQRYEQEKPTLVAKAARHQILAKKYFMRWRANTYRRVMNRRARGRRQMRIDASEREKQKRMRGEAELEAILQAKKEKEQIQAEMLAHNTNMSSPSVSKMVQQAAGQKRKSIHVGRSGDFINGHIPKKIAKGHNRSRTMGHAEAPFVSSRSLASQALATTTAPLSRLSIFFSRPILNDPRPSQDQGQSPLGRKDTTRTDYFKLKALGVDPDTPMVPDTRESLERKRQREKELAIATTRIRARTLSSTARPLVRQVSPQRAKSSEISNVEQSFTPPNTNMTTAITFESGKVDKDEDLLRQIREVREAMMEDTKWFKRQAVDIEKEIEEQKELRCSASQSSARSSPHPSARGLFRANGYEYLPGPDIPGRTLSRTEQRIRRTGAHGLATKPIGGSGDYLAVAMSRDSVARFDKEKQSQGFSDITHITEKKQKAKRKTGAKDDWYFPKQSDQESDELEDDSEMSGLEDHPKPRPDANTRATKAINHTPQPDREQAVDYDNTEGYDDEDDAQESLEQLQYTGYEEFEGGATDGSYEDGDDEEGQYDEDEEGEEGDGEEEGTVEVRSAPHQQGQKEQGQTIGYWLRSSTTPERGLTPNGGQMMSRASSGMGTGTGASADDAFVLDSD